jgi:uncharacterized protein YdiU (UPF0061 family)
LVAASQSTGDLIGLDVSTLSSGDPLKLISGQGALNIWQPIAMKYTGHQFGYYNPDLGDGRGLLIAQVEHENTIWDLHLKGAGMTPYSRQGDGRAVLRSSIREFLCSEAMAGLGIPTTRALSVINSTSPVYREEQETGAMVIRVSQSHIRFGHFEYCTFSEKPELLKPLLNYVIDRHYPQLVDQENAYELFFAITLEKTAKLVAQWQSVGFNHGVMNTDNMSILGETFDYGPFAFLDDYDPHFICNHSDHQGRYAFSRQPNIANWNLSVLAQALLPVIDKDDLIQQLDRFSDIFTEEFIGLMCAKLGFLSHGEKFKPIIESTLNMLAKCKLDYTYFFRQLSSINEFDTSKSLRDMCLDVALFDSWEAQYEKALIEDGQTLENASKRKLRMDKVNPKYILRNYLAQQAIEAAQQGDYSMVNTLRDVLENPFDEQPEFEEYAQLPPDWGKKLEISCSS